MATSSQSLGQDEPETADIIDQAESETVILPELIVMLKNQVQSLAKDLTTCLSSDIAGNLDSLQDCINQLEFLGNAAQASGLSGFQCTLEYLQANVELMSEDGQPLTIIETAMVSAVFDLLQTYLDNINQPVASSNLVMHLQKSQWREPVQEDDAIDLIELLGMVTVASVPVAADVEPVEVTPEDVSIEISAEVNTELLESLLEELPDLIGSFSDAIARIIEIEDVEAVREAQRIAHTLKGSGNMVGITGVANLTHDLEDILEAMAEKGVMPTPELAETLQSASDCLEVMGDALLGMGEAPPQALQVLRNVRNWNRQISAQGQEIADIQVAVAAEPETIPEVVQNLETAERRSPERPSSASEDKASTIRIPTSDVDHLLRISGEGSLLTVRLQEHLKYSRNQVDLAAIQNKKLKRLIEELEQVFQLQGASSLLANSLTPAGFDALEMDQFSELHSHANQLVELTTDISEINSGIDTQLLAMNDLLREQDTLQKDYQEWALKVRLVAIDSIISRCQRVVRQACKMTGKQVQLHIVGEGLLVDNKILEQLIDPLMHILRNSVDHGIESGDLRGIAGKPLVGNIYLSFSRNGRYLNVVCEDDGGGLDYGEIRRKAENKGLLNWSEAVSDEALTQMILMPGFSTRNTASQTSGRGVGMDVVQTQIEDMKGSLTLESHPGEGLNIELQVPMTLLSTPCLLLRCSDQTVAVSTEGVEQIVYPESGQLKQTETGFFHEWGGNTYPVDQLNEMLGLSEAADFESLLAKPALIIRVHDDEKRVILVDGVEDHRDLVVKPMGTYIPTIKGIVGATILGDGSVISVLNMPELFDTTIQAPTFYRQRRQGSGVSDLPKALVVDDSLSARRTLSMFLRDMGFEVETALDGLDAISKITNNIPDVMVTDMEMPRMNGLELTTHVNNREDLKGLPVIMITSRSSAKHQQQAKDAGVKGYLTKPWTEEDLTQQLGQVLEHTE